MRLALFDLKSDAWQKLLTSEVNPRACCEKFLVIMKKLLRKYPGIWIFSAISTFPLHADVAGYFGASTTVSHWQMGLASGKTVQMFGKDFQSNKPDPFLYMAGLSASLVWNKTWALSYQGEGGYSNPTITMNRNYSDGGLPAQTNATINSRIFRTDHSLALSHSIGATGFNVFVGAKVQWFSYTDGNAAVTESGGTRQGTSIFSVKQTMLSGGAAVGVGYSFRLSRKIFGSVQGGGILFPGEFLAIAALPNGTSNSRETYTGYGFTALTSIAISLNEQLFLQIAAKGQYYRIKSNGSTSREPDGAIITNTGTLNEVQDILIGLQASITYRMF